MRFTTMPAVYTEEAAADWIRRQQRHAERRTAVVLAITASSDGAPVGMVGLIGLDRDDHTGRLGYWLLGHARGRGIATAAARALTEWAFVHLGLEQVVIDREPGNQPSARVAEKLAAKQTGARLVKYQGSEVELVRYVISRPRN